MQFSDFPYDKFNFKSNSVIEGLPEEDVALLKQPMVSHSYKKGEILFQEGSYPTAVSYTHLDVYKRQVLKYKRLFSD